MTSPAGERRRYALDTGLICLSTEDPARVPVVLLRHGGPVLLDDAGGVTPVGGPDLDGAA